MFQCFDKVDYIGSKFSSDLHSKVGMVVGRVHNEPGAFVVEFADDAFICSERNLRKHVASAKDEKEPEVRRRRRSDDDD